MPCARMAWTIEEERRREVTYDGSDYGRCESCDKYANLRRAGFCVGCTWTLLTDGARLRSGWTPKQQLMITSLPRINMSEKVRIPDNRSDNDFTGEGDEE